MILLLFLQVPAKALGSNDSYIRTLRTLHWSLVLEHITLRSACASRLAMCPVKMPLLQLTKLSKIVTAILRLSLASRQRLAREAHRSHSTDAAQFNSDCQPLLAEATCRMDRG